VATGSRPCQGKKAHGLERLGGTSKLTKAQKETTGKISLVEEHPKKTLRSQDTVLITPETRKKTKRRKRGKGGYKEGGPKKCS